ncbi:MAG TPA: cytochrome C oxidase subunit II [Terriglobia bacterium]|nr:cytochrome C oxidase subunit II [Terriglobia bacterium]
MALAVALAITCITLATCGLFVFHPWWFPSPISTLASRIDVQFNLTWIVCGILFAAAQLTLAYFAWHYRGSRSGAQATFSRGNNILEGAWAVTATVLFLGLGWTGYRLWAGFPFQGPAPGAMRVEVWGEQFAWYFRYPGPDGRFGPPHPDLMSDGMGNYLGLDRQHDLASRDDIVTTTLAIPVNRPVTLILRSKDMIHSFFVRELRLNQDLVPGRAIPIHFTATRIGRYKIICSELCGMGHYKMHADLVVMTGRGFQEWLRKKAEQQ